MPAREIRLIDAELPGVDEKDINVSLDDNQLIVASADAIWSRLTIVGTIDENDGIESASVMPTISDSATTIQGSTVPVSRRTTRAAGHSI